MMNVPAMTVPPVAGTSGGSPCPPRGTVNVEGLSLRRSLSRTPRFLGEAHSRLEGRYASASLPVGLLHECASPGQRRRECARNGQTGKPWVLAVYITPLLGHPSTETARRLAPGPLSFIFAAKDLAGKARNAVQLMESAFRLGNAGSSMDASSLNSPLAAFGLLGALFA